MVILSRSNVDGHIPVWETFASVPSYDDLYQMLEPYWDCDIAAKAAMSLSQNGYASVEDSAGTVYKLVNMA
jgi:hypothetical protein